MHPIFASRTRLGLYLLCWIPIAGLLNYMLYISGGEGAGAADQFVFFGNVRGSLSILIPFVLCDVYAFVCLSPWYLCRVLPIGTVSIGKILRSHAAAALVASFFWIILAKALGLLLSRWDPPVDARLSRELPMLFVVGLLLYVLAISLHYVLLSFQTSREAELRAQESRMLAREAELKALKAQINPHFLFNSLNSISALTMVDAAQARDMCIRLSDFLRSTLNLGEKETIPMADEMALVRTYLGVEKVRFGARLRIEEHVDKSCGGCSIPPLLVQPLVENAIKHGVAGLVEGGTIKLDADCTGGRLRVRVENEFDHDAPMPRRSGLGLMNVRSRLRTRYDNNARLDTVVRGNCFLAELSLPCETPHHA